MGENENYLFFGNYCSLRPFVGEKMKIIYFLETIAALGLKVAWSIQLNELMKFSEYQRSMSFFDLGQRSLRFQSQNLFFSKITGQFGTKVHIRAWGRMGMKIYTNDLVHMTKMATMPINGKNLKKSSSPEPIYRWPWNLVYSIVHASTTKVVQIMTLGWPWPILRQGQIWLSRLLYGRKWKLFIFWKLLQA